MLYGDPPAIRIIFDDKDRDISQRPGRRRRMGDGRSVTSLDGVTQMARKRETGGKVGWRGNGQIVRYADLDNRDK